MTQRLKAHIFDILFYLRIRWSIKISSPHDRYLRSVLAHPKVIRDFLEKSLKGWIQEALDWNSLEFQKDSYVDDHLKMQVTDLLFSAKFNGESGFLYILIEHASRPDPLLPFRMLKYQIAIMEDFLKKNADLKNKPKLPLVVPIVLYTGRSQFTHSMDFLDLFEPQKNLAKTIWQSPCTLIDLSQMSYDELQKYEAFKAAALAAKDIHKLKGEECLEAFYRILEALRALDEAGEESYIKITLTYLAEASEIPSHVFIEGIQEKLTEKTAMNLLQELQKEGYKKGKHEGERKGRLETLHQMAYKLLENGFSLDQVADYTALPVEEIRALQKKKTH